MRCKEERKSVYLDTESFDFGVPLSVVGLFEMVYFVWIEGRFAGLNLPDDCGPDFLVEVEGSVPLTDEFFDAGSYPWGIR